VLDIENCDDPFDNGIPAAHEIRKTGSGAFWNFMAPLLGSRGKHVEPVDPALERMRRNIAHYAPPPMDVPVMPSVVQEIVAEAVAAVEAVVQPIVEAVSSVKASSALETAKSWLLAELAAGPKGAVALATAAKGAGVAGRTLERARKSLKLKPRRMQGRVYWMLPEPESAKKWWRG
jgi:hypothetical protein